MLATDSDFASLVKYKLLRKRFLYLAAAFIPSMVILMELSRVLVGSYLPAQIVVFAFLAVLAVLWSRLSYWPCPECKGFIGWWPPLVARCRRCGFPIVRDEGRN
jgi:hypothetical protein